LFLAKSKYKYIYGPVGSWRLGKSLGIDLLSQKEKICTFDCLYCQVGRKKACPGIRKVYVPTEKIIAELKSLQPVKVDYITFSGHGEPTLAKNLGQTIKAIRKISKIPVAVLTNSSLLGRKDVRNELSLADLVACKLDACSQNVLDDINRPARRTTFTGIFKGLKKFKKQYHKKLALQIMFTKWNIQSAKKLAELTRQLDPYEIQINTPLRPSGVKPLSREEIRGIKKYFREITGCKNIVAVYDVEREKVLPISKKDTLKRRGTI
jgi:wyosine [tRNA(Phe)-imidazoG37] synthetase (radical SAM superfamily)